MANLTKTQIKKKLGELLDKIESLKMDLEDLASDIENESNDIEPYAGKNNLTSAQEERKDWLDDALDKVGYAADYLGDASSNLEEIM